MSHREITDEDLARLVERVRGATAALMQGDIHRYLALVNHAPDYTLMSPTGGPTRHGFDSSPASIDELEKTFAGGGDGDLELVQQYASGDLAVLVGVERQHGPVAGLPAQEWPLRVTLVFRRENSDWRLVHRHADALVHPSAWSSSLCLRAARSSPVKPSVPPQSERERRAGVARQSYGREGSRRAAAQRTRI
jgi:ketosteroid isomerase-like protein